MKRLVRTASPWTLTIVHNDPMTYHESDGAAERLKCCPQMGCQIMDDYTSKSWQNACEGPYHQYLEYLSPDYNNILIYSRYGQKFWFADPEQNLALQRRSPLHSVHVIDLGDADNKVAKFQCGLEYIRRNIDKIDFLSELTLLREHICSPADSDNVKVFMRVILVPNLMGPLIETLGAALSLEPDVFSYHIGSAYKSMGQYSKEVIAGSNADRMTQESGWRRARLPTADVVVSRDSAQYSAFDRELKTGTGCTITIWLPRTLCVQSSTMDLNLVTEMWEKEMKQILLLQERLLFRRFGQFRSIPSYEGLDRRVKFTQLGIEILQRITVHVRRYANGDILYALVCLPPRNSSNVPNVTIFEDPLPVDSAKWSFNEYWKERQSREPRRDTKGHDEIENISQAVGSISPGNGFDQLHGLLDLLHSYAARSWFQRLRILEDHLDTLDRSLSMRNPQNCVCPYTASDLEEVGKGVLRYIESIKDSIVTLELQLADDPRCSLDDSQGNPRRDHSKNQELLTKFRYLQSKMSMLSVRAEHLLSAQRTQAQTTLTELQIEESRKSIQQAETVKRLTILAFVFIPLSCVCSAFGMNIREMDDHPRIWIFVLVAVGVTLSTIIVAATYKSVTYKSVHQQWDRFSNTWIWYRSWHITRYGAARARRRVAKTLLIAKKLLIAIGWPQEDFEPEERSLGPTSLDEE